MIQRIGRALYIATFSAILACPSVAAPTPPDPEAIQKGVAVFIGTAEQICGGIESKGSSTTFELSGQAEATMNGAVKKFFDVGGGVGSKYTRHEYENVLQKDLLALNQIVRPCRERVFMRLLDIAYPPKGTPPLKSTPAASSAAAGSASKDASQPPGAAPHVDIHQDNRGATGPIIGNVETLNVYTRAPDVVLRDAPRNIAAQLLAEAKGNLCLEIPMRVAGIADGQSTPLGNQLLNLFASWKPQISMFGMTVAPPGITLYGNTESEAYRQVKLAFDTAQIPFLPQPDNGQCTGPNSGGNVSILVNREI